MNRHQRRREEARIRADEARMRMTANSEHVKRIVAEAHTVADEADRFKMLLFSIAREQGRIRIKASQLAALTENDRVDFIHQDNGDVIVQYSAGERVPQGRASEPQVGER